MDRERIFFLTGAASGIGKHLAKALAGRGNKVLATDIDERGLAALPSSSGRLIAQRLDVTRAEDWEKALDAAERSFGLPDVVLNVAGYLKPGFIHEVDDRAIDLHLDVNIKGVILGTRAAARRMVVRGAGHIINFGSLASLAAVPGLCLYSASKFAVRGISLAAAAELAPHGVAVTLIMPDAVQTPMLDMQVDYPEAAMTFSGDRPLTVDDIEEVLIEKILPGRPLEIAVPLSRGLLARLANTAPGVALRLAPQLTRKGRREQEKLKSRK